MGDVVVPARPELGKLEGCPSHGPTFNGKVGRYSNSSNSEGSWNTGMEQ